jgi:F-type H+-transporting ATPase subunit gamma
MATLRDIKRRIASVTNIQQITKAMKMVAAARLRRAQENVISARPYSNKITQVLSDLVEMEADASNPLFIQREVKKVALVVVTSDKGMCGGFNMNIIKKVEELLAGDLRDCYLENNLSLYCIGKKCVDYFSKRNYKIESSYPNIFSGLKFEFAVKLVSELKQKYLSGEFDKVIIIYNEFKSVIQQRITEEQFLPVKPFEKKNDSKESFTEFIYEPDKRTIVDKLVPRHLNAQMWKVLLESYAAELGARMTAMDMATENAKELINSLKITYNKERQSAITTEILEIVSGANALKES